MTPMLAATMASKMTTTVPVIFCPTTVRSDANAIADKSKIAAMTAKC